MNDDMKIPLSHRPPFKEVAQRLNDKVSLAYRQLLTQDIQNDCACGVETYECDNKYGVWCLGEGSLVKKMNCIGRICIL